MGPNGCLAHIPDSVRSLDLSDAMLQDVASGSDFDYEYDEDFTIEVLALLSHASDIGCGVFPRQC